MRFLKSFTIIVFTLVALEAYSAPNEYEQDKNDGEGSGTTARALNKVGSAVAKVFEVIVEAPRDFVNSLSDAKIANQIIEIQSRNYDTENDDVHIRRLRYSIEAIGYPGVDNSFGLLPVKISISATDGEGINLAEAKISVFKIVTDNGFTINYLVLGRDNNERYSTDTIQTMVLVNLAEIGYEDVAYSSKNKRAQIVLGGNLSFGHLNSIRSNGQNVEFSGHEGMSLVYEFGGHAGVRINDAILGGSLTLEGFTRKLGTAYDGPENISVMRTGAQLVYKTKNKAWSVALGVANETAHDIAGNKDKGQEVYFNAKREF